MKQIPAALQAHYDSGGTSVAHAVVIERVDGQLFGFTSHDLPFVLDVTPWGLGSSALVFDAKQGLTASNLVSTSGFAVDNLELTTLDDGSLFQRDEVLAGVWRNASFRIFRYRWDVAAPTVANDVETLTRGWFGEVTLNSATIKVELRGLKQLLQQSVGEVSTKTCRNRLGDGRCRVDLAPWTHAGEITAVADKRSFTAAGLAQAADYFGEGVLAFTTGANAGLSQKVRSHAAGGALTLVLPMVMAVAVGDQFSIVAGCRKRLMEDCKGKFGNVPNFRGEPHRPTTDDLTKTP